MAYLGFDPDEEIRFIDAKRGARDRGAQAAALWSESQARYAAHLSRVLPWAAPGQLLALAKGNAPASTVRRLGEMAALDRARRNPSGMPYGSTVRGAQV